VVALNVTATLFQITTVPSGRSFTADGIGYSAPQGFPWAPNSQHTIAITTSPQPGGTGTQYAYSSWSDAGAQSHTETAGSSPATYTANFSTQYYLTTVASPPADGSISPASNWYNAGSVVSVTATPNAGSTFSGFSGALTGTTTPQNVTMSSPASVTANFGTTTYTISGTILGASGGPLANITVKLNGGSSSVQTDGNGQYSFPSLAPGNYTVSPSSMSHSFCPATTTFALSGSQTANFNADGPAREYIRLGSRVIAIANCGSP
jgi:hypothetical protein